MGWAGGEVSERDRGLCDAIEGHYVKPHCRGRADRKAVRWTDACRFRERQEILRGLTREDRLGIDTERASIVEPRAAYRGPGSPGSRAGCCTGQAAGSSPVRGSPRGSKRTDAKVWEVAVYPFNKPA